MWAASLRRGSAVLQQNGWTRQIAPVLTFNRVKVYLACNRAVTDALVEQMNAAVDAMARDGTIRRIDRKYEHWGEAKSCRDGPPPRFKRRGALRDRVLMRDRPQKRPR